MQESLSYIDASEPKIVDNEHLLKVEDIKSEKDIDSNGATGEDPTEIENATVLFHDGKKQIQVDNFQKVPLFTILSKNLNANSAIQYCCVDKSVKYFNKMKEQKGLF